MVKLKFSIVMPIRNEVNLLERSLTSCYEVGPSEVVLVFDNPPHRGAFGKAKEIAGRYDIPTKFLKVRRNPEWKFHQAYVRRTGFNVATYDRILTVDADLVINRNVLKAVRLVRKNNVGLVSCCKFYPFTSILSLWRAIMYNIARYVYPLCFTGLYAFWRPFWVDSEDDGIKSLQDPRLPNVKGTLTCVGEDTYLRNCMQLKHRCTYIRDIGCHCLTSFYEDKPHTQFEYGRNLFEEGHTFRRVLFKSFMYARPHIIRGWVYQKFAREKIPINPVISPFTYTKKLIEMLPEIKTYWEKNLPWNFSDKPLTYEEKRKLRYDLQDYMHKVFRFPTYKKFRVLDLGCGSGIDSVEFARHGAKVVSVDLAKTATRLTKQHFRESGQDGDIVQASGSSLPFRRSKFDVVYSFGVLHHIPNVENVLSEIQRVLKWKGTILAMVYNKDSLVYSHSILMKAFEENISPEEAISKFSERVEGCPYTKAYTKEEVLEGFGRYFRNLHVSVHYNVIDLPNKRKVKFKLDDETEKLGWHLIVQGVRRGKFLGQIL